MTAPGYHPLPNLSEDQQARWLLDAITDYAIFLLDPRGCVVSWNTGAERLKRYSAREIIGQHFSVFYPAVEIEAGRPGRLLAAATAEGRVEDEGWRVRKDGTRFWADVIITALRQETGAVVGFVKITRDLTERRQAELALHESEQRFRVLVEGVRDHALFMLSPEGIVVSWNAGAQRIKGYSAEEILGRHFSLFYRAEDISEGKPQLELEVALAQGRYEDEGWRVRKDGSRFWANVVLTPVRDESGTLVGFAKITRDMTDRRRAREELRLTQKRNRALQGESVAKDEFLGVLAHELRTPLTVLYGGTRLLAARYEQLEEADRRELVESLADESSRMKSLIESLFMLVNPDPDLELTETSLDGQVRFVAAEFLRIVPARDLHLELPEGDVGVIVEVALFQRVLLNLLGNAHKYSPARSPIDLVVTHTANEAVVEVRDRGPGVEPAELGLIFDSFYRSPSTADAVQGKGIGLAICRRLVDLFGGSIQARARDGGGLIVRVTLPARPAD